MATATADIAACLPRELKEAFEKHYRKQGRIRWNDTDGSCSRCGSNVPAASRSFHELWHKNSTCQLWMISRFPMEHMRQHQEEGRVIAELIGSILGFIDPPDEAEPEPFMELRGDDNVIAHVHEDGTTHAH